MTNTIDIPWKRYALIAELAKRLEPVSPQFGKTALQKLVFFLQEVYEIDCGYDFSLYSYGPFDSQLLGDLDLVEHWGCVSVTRINNTPGGYQIRPADGVDSIRDKAAGFLDATRTKQAIDDLIAIYGAMTAKDLELRATTVYVAKNLKTKWTLVPKENVCDLVGQIKPKFTAQEIEQAVMELSERDHIQITV
jgi:uncharacterized protein YwgA